MKRIIIILCCIATVTYVYGLGWTTYFAYNQVTQIAMSPDRVYAVSDGSLYSVEKASEKIQTYGSQSGLHSTGISCIYYDEAGSQLFIAYKTGKIDLMRANGVQYISDLYDKDMTQRKTVNNITIHGRMAYLSTAFGIQTMDLKQNKLVDSYWLRPNGAETDIQDVLLLGDSIYAFTTDSLFCAKMSDNIVDYRFWKRELRSGRIAPDVNKGVHYQDGTSDWYAGGAEGIVRISAAERVCYKPAGPIANFPYSITAKGGQVWAVPGGRWAVQNFRPGIVMHYNGEQWVNIENYSIQSKTGLQALDFMNSAVDPRDPSHYFITSYGTGLYEFRADSLVKHYLPAEDNTIVAIIPDVPTLYTRLDCAMYDEDNNLWFFTTGGEKQLQCLDANQQWHAVSIRENGGGPFDIPTPTGLFVDKRNANHKWFSIGRSDQISLVLLDDGGTRWEESDDRIQVRKSWTDQHGRAFQPLFIYGIAQDALERVWIITENGAGYIDNSTDYLQSDAIVRPDIEDENGENPITSLQMSAIAIDSDGQIWLGTNDLGIYVLDGAATEITAHYTTGNSAMPSNTILSLSADANGKVWIGTSEGLVCCDTHGSGEGLNGKVTDEEDHLDPGSMMQWRLHLSYNDATEVVGSRERIYAIANGALFSFDRADEALEYWDQSKGLNGNTISHICLDKSSQNLVIVYYDGRIDLMDKDGSIRQMPDLYTKAGTVSFNVNRVRTGERYTYLAMSFGIIAIDCKRGEVKDSYYIGHEAADVDVLAVFEKGDSIYAFSADTMYSGCMRDNLADYHFWHASKASLRNLSHAETYHDQIFTVQHDSLYRYQNGAWGLVDGKKISWIHASEGKLLVCSESKNLYELNEEGEFIGLCDRYHIHDAIYSQGEYWLGEQNWGLIRLGSNGDDYYHTEGPNTNSAYFIHAAHGYIYAVNGGRWATEYIRPARVNVYDGTSWRCISEYNFAVNLNKRIIDPVSIAVDNEDPGHFYVAAYGCGVIEFRDFQPVKQHSYYNSSLRPVNSTIDPDFFTRTDGAMMDKEGNLWVLNSTTVGQPLHVLTKSGQWVGLNMRSGGTNIVFNTPAGIWPDRRDSRYKWMMDQRTDNRGVVFHFDNGTPTTAYDDYCMHRNSFIDQNNNLLSPTFFYCLTQDKNNRVWIGTEKGILIIPSEVDFFKSDACKRIIIPRNDGTGLGDYLLGEEQIQCMLADEGNRMWIGTAGSGLYLIEDDTITVAHFTETNSLLPSNNVLSLTIVPETGELFVGTEKGIASYRSDASEAKEDMSGAYAYPNPVRPDYGGVISITGLMDNSEVRIIDAGGGLVCRTRSHGGTAVWDGKLPDGRRATPGVYTALCNSLKGHTAVKILVIR